MTLTFSPSPKCLFCWTDGIKPRDVQFAMILDREQQQIFTVEKLEPVNVCFINHLSDLIIIKLVVLVTALH